MWRWFMIPCAAVAMWAADGGQPWKDKLAKDWSQDDAKQILSKSPWAQAGKPEPAPIKQPSTRIGMGGGGMGGGGMGGGGMGGGRRGGGIGFPGGGIGFPGGGGQRGGGGYPGGNGGGRGQRGGRYPEPGADTYEKPAPMTIRWESAAPIKEAEEIAHDKGAPSAGTLTATKYYAIAVYGLAQRMTNESAKELKKHATLQREGKKDIKPERVQVLQREEGPVVLYLFPRSAKIKLDDGSVTFDAIMGRIQLVETFDLQDMLYNDKLEL